MYYLCRRKAASQQNIQASLIFCTRFAFPLQKKSGTRQSESAIRAPQGASITTKGGHNRRPAPVIYYDPKGSTQEDGKLHFSWKDLRNFRLSEALPTQASNCPGSAFQLAVVSS